MQSRTYVGNANGGGSLSSGGHCDKGVDQRKMGIQSSQTTKRWWEERRPTLDDN